MHAPNKNRLLLGMGHAPTKNRYCHHQPSSKTSCFVLFKKMARAAPAEPNKNGASAENANAPFEFMCSVQNQQQLAVE